MGGRNCYMTQRELVAAQHCNALSCRMSFCMTMCMTMRVDEVGRVYFMTEDAVGRHKYNREDVRAITQSNKEFKGRLGSQIIGCQNIR